MKDIQARFKQGSLARRLQSAIAYVETFLELYQRKEDPLELVQPLEAVVGMPREIRQAVLLQELTTILHNEDLPAATKKEKVVKTFQLLV